MTLLWGTGWGGVVEVRDTGMGNGWVGGGS